ncbi:MAG: MFS transporter [Thermoleophilia bacterium]|nr:MFS transporter [Thermoleophilia bacterium]
MGEGIDRRAMASLSTGHLATDLAQGSVPALLVFLVPKLDLSYTLAAAVVLVATFSSSVVQPLFGAWSDQRGALWMLPGGVALAGVGVALAAVAPSYPLLLAAVLAGGVGVAAYHPEGSKLASYVSGSRRATGMAVFSVGGNIGFGLGPLFASTLVIALGLSGGLLLALPGLLVAGYLLAERGYLSRFVAAGERRTRESPEPDRAGAFALLQGVVVLRSIAHYGLFTFVPLWEVAQGGSEQAGTRLLSLFLLAGAVGTLVGGPLADRLGRKPVIVVTHAVAAPLVVVYVLAGGIGGDIALVAAGAAVISTFGITTVLSQEYLPRRLGMASGLSVGLAIGLGGIFAVTLGAVADAIDLRTAVLATAIGPALGALVALALPSPWARALVERAPAAAP